MGYLIGLLVPSVGAKFAKIIVYGGLALLILLALWGGKCAYDRHVIANHEAQVQQRAAPATDQAATERAHDTINNSKQEEELHNAVASQPDQPISPTSHALACERLRHAGRNPPSCR